MKHAGKHDLYMSLSDIELRNKVYAESWDYSDANTQHLTHNIHRYSGKFIPQIAARAISILTKPNELVVDPYCGSGTTLVEAALLGRNAIGIDLNPLAILIARTKITPVPVQIIESLRNYFHQKLTTFELEQNMPIFTSNLEKSFEIANDPRISDEWYCKWFQPRILEALIAIDLLINRIDDIRCQDIARIAFSDIIRKSSNAHSGYPNVMFDKNATKRSYPVKPFLKALDRVCSMVSSLVNNNAKWENVSVKLGTAVALHFDDCSVDAIVTHPPYIGSIPYAEYGALSLKWLGVDPKKLDNELTGGRRQSPRIIERFKTDYLKMLFEVSRVLKPNRHAFLMVGNPLVRGEIIDLAQITINLAEKAGLRLVANTVRNGINRRANRMGVEHLLFFAKLGK